MNGADAEKVLLDVSSMLGSTVMDAYDSVSVIMDSGSQCTRGPP